MRPDAAIQIFEEVGAIRHGHFELTSGLHSEAYVQCALVLQYPKYAEQLGRALAAFFHDLRIGCVTSPALGGVLVGHEVARALPAHTDGTPVPAIFVERDAKGTLTLRRGFRVAPEERILMVEDVWTTGGSTRETMRVIEQAGGRVVAALKVENFDPAECPLCRAGSVAVKPGSHFVRANA